MSKRYVWLLMVLCGSGIASTRAVEPDGSKAFEQWQVQLDDITRQLEIPGLGDEQLRQARSEIEALRTEAAESVEERMPDLDAVRAELEALGPPPADGEDPEPASVVAQRENIRARLQEIQGRIKEAELIGERSERVIDDIAETRRARFAERLSARGPSPFSPEVWRRVMPQIVAASAFAGQALHNVLTVDPLKIPWRDSMLAVILAAALAIFFAWPLHRWLLGRFGRDPAVRTPALMQALRAMLVVGAVRALLPTAAAALVYVVAVNRPSLPPNGRAIAEALLLGFVFFAWVVAFFRASLSPAQPAWRVLPVPDNFARGMWRFVVLLTFVYALDIVLSEVLVIYGARLEIMVIRDYLVALLVIMLLAILLLRQGMWRPNEEPSSKPRWRVPRLLGAITLILFPVIGAFGYVALMRFVATQTLLTGGLVLLLLILHRLGRELVAQFGTGENGIAISLRENLHYDSEGARRLVFWFGLGYDALLLLFGFVVALFVWGADREDVGRWLYQAAFGFQIGKINISLIEVATALLVVAVLVALTRFIQRALADKVLPQTRLDSGICESIRQTTGYIGMVVAAVAGVGVLGLDLSNFALIAGALTVGIGFGLQNVVNNFVSGLILLAERPVKVGDWIVVGDQQGYVKRIQVRATEIQTFDRASVFIPNSELISGIVTNWTHADKIGRIVIPVGVAYGSNTKNVRSTLLGIGQAHPQVLNDPAPTALFRGFGDSSLNFELRCFLGDVEKTISVTSELCFAIEEAFRDADIEIPFPQHDVYLRERSRSEYGEVVTT
ncbi:MAG: DUF3772 domain-containing protein [Gammaproteobacteria bacterium]